MGAVFRRTAPALAALVLAAAATAPLFSQPAALTVLSRGTLNTVTRRSIATTTVNEQEYVALDENDDR